MKQLQSLRLFVMLATLTMTMFIPDRVWAQDPSTLIDESTVVVLNDGDNNVDIQNPTYNENNHPLTNGTIFKYIVKRDCDITITSVGDKDPDAVLFDSSLTNFIDSSAGANFMFTIENAHTGDVYYIGVRGHNGSIGQYVINVMTKPVGIEGSIIVGANEIDLENYASIDKFNADNSGKMDIGIEQIVGRKGVVLTLNNVTLTNSNFCAIGAFTENPLMVRLIGENTLNVDIVREVNSIRYWDEGLYAQDGLWFAGSGTLNINVAKDVREGSAIDAEYIQTVDDLNVDKIYEVEGTPFPENQTFSGTININSECESSNGIDARSMMLCGGNLNIKVNVDNAISVTEQLLIFNSNVKLEGGFSGIFFKNQANEAKGSKKNAPATSNSLTMYDVLAEYCDFAVVGGSLEITNAMRASINAYAIDNISYFIAPISSNDSMVIETGDTRETAKELDYENINLFGQSENFERYLKNYLHIYQKAGEDETATAIDSYIKPDATANNKAYNIMGQRVNKNTKGLIIVNGRTFVNK